MTRNKKKKGIPQNTNMDDLNWFKHIEWTHNSVVTSEKPNQRKSHYLYQEVMYSLRFSLFVRLKVYGQNWLRSYFHETLCIDLQNNPNIE